ncbi:uncharacterized protein LOC107266656 [Cephus cinctus]|uniref:Uncharacterized protein LOC107266656 n=1 Tax=Cephus cinctus TaxID=211228 RepID=A0AAJ7FI22_CEPCN|nr:uncharacterized protein LOC107266656 [Cephus cinctus]
MNIMDSHVGTLMRLCSRNPIYSLSLAIGRFRSALKIVRFVVTIVLKCKMKSSALFVLLLVTIVQSKPIDRSIDETENEIENGSQSDYKNSPDDPKDSIAAGSDLITVPKDVETQKSDNVNQDNIELVETTTRIPQPPASWFLTPLLQKIQFSPQAFLQDRLGQIKEIFKNLAAVNPQNAKQLAATSGLLNLVGLSEPGFYTDRLDAAGFLGGNGWFANKGGILGGPGALVSTGSLLTDYPTPYKK